MRRGGPMCWPSLSCCFACQWLMVGLKECFHISNWLKMTDEPALRKILLIGCSESMWKAHHSQIGMQVALLSYGWRKRYKESTSRSPNATPLQLLRLSIWRKTPMLMKHSPSMTGRNGSNHDCTLSKLYNKLCILKVNLTPFLIGQFGINSVSTIVMLFARMYTSITIHWLLMIDYWSVQVWSNCAGVWSTAILSRQNVQQVSGQM